MNTSIAPEHPAADAQPTQDASSPCERYMRRAREHLESLPVSQRLGFIRSERTKFLIEHARFERRMARGQKPQGGEQAVDYILIIAELGKLKTAEERKAAVIPVEAANA